MPTIRLNILEKSIIYITVNNIYIICEKNQAPLAPASGPIDICRNTPLLVRNNQSEPGGVS